MAKIKELTVTSPSFTDHGAMPVEHTGFGADISPAFKLNHVSEQAVSIAIIMDDLDIPMIKAYNHWLIWNIPNTEEIPGNIPYAPTVPSLGNAIQGCGYGRNRYRGPRQPFFVRNTHRYIFTFYTLDCLLNLDSNTRKNQLLTAMEGHIIQQATITGTYKR